MDGDPTGHERRFEPPPFDVNVAHPARVYDYWLGGKDNYPADKEAAEKVLAINPKIAIGVRSNRAFLKRVTRFFVTEAGIDQILDIGTGLPSADNVHEVAQAAHPGTKVVYVDNDPIVHVHAHALLTGEPGTVDYVHADLRDPDYIMGEAAKTLDFSRPVAVMILMTLQFVPDEDKPQQIVRSIMDRLPSGSWLAVSQPATIDHDVTNQATAQYNQLVSAPMTRRSPEQIAAFFEGLEIVEPGVVTLDGWHPDPGQKVVPIPAMCAVGRKP